MRLFVTVFFAVISVSSAQQQQQVDPAYLRQYYAQQTGAQAPQARATPIYETQEQPQYLQQQQGPLKNVRSIHPFRTLHKVGGLNREQNIWLKKSFYNQQFPRPAQHQQQSQQAYVQEPQHQPRQYQQPAQQVLTNF